MTLKQFLEQAFEHFEGSRFYQNTLIESTFAETTVKYYGTLIARIDHDARQASFYNANYSISTKRRVNILQHIAAEKDYTL